jgi:hypothetical protein
MERAEEGERGEAHIREGEREYLRECDEGGQKER